MALANHHIGSGSSVSMNNKKKTTKGRKKIEIKKIEEANSRQVTFSKLKPTSSSNNNQYSSPPPLPVQEFNQHYTEVSRELEAEKKRRDQMIIPSSSTSSLPWFEGPTEGMDEGELDLFLWSLLELRRKVLTRADELMMINRPQSSNSAAAGVFDHHQMRWKNYVNGGQTTTGHDPTNNGGGFVFQHHGIGGSGDQILPKF
ncbi:uncharacterized protein LOC143596589 [Bidens hawaiensis]|uniref:uncharacterized protein LOC143596589 n=1 Tax=Bidens hawaiensis TaxID=980011 RepID=UPI004049830F